VAPVVQPVVHHGDNDDDDWPAMYHPRSFRHPTWDPHSAETHHSTATVGSMSNEVAGPSADTEQPSVDIHVTGHHRRGHRARPPRTAQSQPDVEEV